jgi:hypothetical protein
MKKPAAKTKPGEAFEYLPELPPKLTAPRLNLKNLLANRHDLGPVRTRKELTTTAQTDRLELSNLAERVLADLVATGTREPVLGQAITAEVLGEGLRRLRDLAFAGDADAMQAYGHTLRAAVADLAELARQKPDVVRAWSCKQAVVPVITGRNAGHRKALDADLDAFAVGEKSVFRVNPPKGKRAPDVTTGANQIAGHLVQFVATHSASLPLTANPPKWLLLAYQIPTLTTGSAEKWIEAIWSLLLHETDGTPQKIPALAALGAKGARKDGLGGNRTQASNCRAEIKQSLREAVLTLAARSSEMAQR